MLPRSRSYLQRLPRSTLAPDSDPACSLRPRWSFGTFCPSASLTSVREAYRGGTPGDKDLLCWDPPGQAQPPEAATPGCPGLPRLPAPRRQVPADTAGTPHPRGQQPGLLTTLLSSGRRRPPRACSSGSALLPAPACAPRSALGLLPRWARSPLGLPPTAGEVRPEPLPQPHHGRTPGDPVRGGPPVGRNGLSWESGPCLDSIYTSLRVLHKLGLPPPTLNLANTY